MQGKLATIVAILLLSASQSALAEPVFNRIASFPVARNLPEGTDPETPTSGEIIAASDDGKTLVYSDSPHGGIGFIDISDPADPKVGGWIDMGGEPTSVAVSASVALVAVNTSESFSNPSGRLAVIEMTSHEESGESCDLGGQPDSIAISPDGTLAAIAIENERDEEVNEGKIPQEPAGYLMIYPLRSGIPVCGDVRKVKLAGLSETASPDPEPEFVDINENNEIAVTLQENNHIVIVDGATGRIVSHFSAGSVDLEGIDATDDGRIAFTDSQSGVRREPDAVHWLGANRLVTANEGDYEGGSRGFTIFNRDGSVVYESGATYEHALAAVGHYPEGRSDSKGVEPEGLETAVFGEDRLVFVLSERGSAIGVYRATDSDPELLQVLPSGIGPESAVAIPSRNLLVSSNEVDLVEDGGARSHVMIFQRAENDAVYPDIVSVQKDNGLPIGWGALSGLAADAQNADVLYAVNDSAYPAAPTIYTIDKSERPARITAAAVVTRDGKPAEGLDLEGIVADGSGGFWLANEGDAKKKIPHELIRVDGSGAIVKEIPFPAALLQAQTRYGSEGVAIADGKLWIAIQRPWKDDPKNMTKLLSYDPGTERWGAALYPLDEPQKGGWVGLSEIAAKGDALYLIERDNKIGSAARIKQITRVPLSQLQTGELGEELPVVKKEVVLDLIPRLQETGGYVVDKVEGLTFDAEGVGYVVTDNDGVDDSSGETRFFSVDLSEVSSAAAAVIEK